MKSNFKSQHRRTGVPPVAPPRARTGFTLIELLVVISIIAALVAIGVPMGAKFLSNSNILAQGAVLKALAAAADEYNIATGKTVDHKSTVDAFGASRVMNVGGTNDDTLGWFIYTAGQVPSASRMIVAAAKNDLQDTRSTPSIPIASVEDSVIDGINVADIQLLDIWGTQIRYAGGTSHSDSFNADNYLPSHPTAFFASAGPDGLWGTTNDDNVPDDDAADNVYSFDAD